MYKSYKNIKWKNAWVQNPSGKIKRKHKHFKREKLDIIK